MQSAPFAPGPAILLPPFGHSVAISVGFGYFPARRAARMNPIDALRRH